MRIGRLEFGFIKFRYGEPRWKWIPMLTHCGCYAVEFWRFFFTWLSDECMPSKKKITYGEVDLVDRGSGPAIVWDKEIPMATKKKATKKTPAKKKATKKTSKKK